jgi:hypothetical protein
MSNIKVSAQVFAQMRERLLALHPSLAEDDTALMDTLDGETEFFDVALALFESMENDKLMAAALKERIGDMRERLARLEARAEAKRGTLAQAMQDAGVPKIEAPQATLSLRHNAPGVGVVIIDEAALPSEYLVEKITHSPDKPSIRAALEKGPVLGAMLSNPSMSLAVRTK